MKQTMLAMLRQAADEFKQVTFVAKKTDEGWLEKSFQDVLRDSRACAAALRARGIDKNDTIAILAEGSTDWVIGEFATLWAGGISVPLSIKLQPEEIPYRINHSDARAIFVSKNMLPRIADIYSKFSRKKIRLIVIDENGTKLTELQSNVGEALAPQIELFSDLLLEGYRSLEDSEQLLQQIENDTREDDVVTISYTSGTTGNPKGIMLTHRNYYANCRDSVEMFAVPRASYRSLLILPCDHSFAHTVGIYAALFRGISLYFVDARGGGMAILRNIPANLAETNPTFLLTVPSLTGNFMKKIKAGIKEKGKFVQMLFEWGLSNAISYHGNGYNRPPLSTRLGTYLPYKLVDLLLFRQVRKIFGSRIQFCVGGGALLDVKQQEFFNAIGVPIYQGYGLTEAAPVISSNLPSIHKFGSSGRVAPTVECKILNDEGGETGFGEVGQIVIRGDNVMKGYFKNPSETKETIQEGRLFTGDLGYYDEDGFLVVTGRAKALLIGPDGEKYSPEAIEEAIINSTDLIDQAILYNDHNQYTSALIVPDLQSVNELLQQKGLSQPDQLLHELNKALFAFQQEPNYKNLFPSVWLPAAFQVLTDGFTEENQLINSTMKMVRYKIIQAHRDSLEYMYTEEGKHFLNPKNRTALATLFPQLNS
ncbi:MAG: AMP-binding protein [Spirochaetia bacterium]|nr:AMP-binding protein [Spirochaetia bacterium]